MIKAVFLLVPAAAMAAWGADIEFSAAPAAVAPGATAHLSWSAPAGNKAVVLGVGEVPHSGSLDVSPKASTAYTLVVEGPQGFSAKTVKVDVQDVRGVDMPSDYDLYRYPLSTERAVPAKTAFLSAVFRVLQDDLNFSVRTSALNPGDVQYVTNSSERSDLVDPPDSRRMRARRISYLVEVQDRPSGVACIVKALIEFQLRAESTWRVEGREDLYQRKCRELLTRLAQIP